MPRCRFVVLLAVMLTTLAVRAPCGRWVWAQDMGLQGTYRVTADRTTVQVPEWGPDCGPRPESHTGTTGRQVTVTVDGSQLVIQDGRRRHRTDACWSDNPRVRRVSATHAGNRWTIVCETPPEDYQHEQGTYTLSVDGDDVLTLRDATEYSWQLRGSRCRASAIRTVRYERIHEAPVQGSTPSQDAGGSAGTVSSLASRCANPGAPVRVEIVPSRRALAAGGRVCFRLRLLDGNQCETSVPTGQTVVWQLARVSGTPGNADATMDNGCVRAPVGSPVGEYTVTATVGTLSARAVAAVVSAEELRSLVAQHIEDEEPERSSSLRTGTASGAGVGAVVLGPSQRNEDATGRWSVTVWLLVATGVLLTAGGIALLVHRRGTRKVSTVSLPANDAAARPSDPSMRSRREVVPIPVHEAVPPTGSTEPVLRTPEQRPLVKRCPRCDARFTAEMAFCPEHGIALVDVHAQPITSHQGTSTAAGASSSTEPTANRCPTCGRPVERGARFCPHDGTLVEGSTPVLICPKCNKRYEPGVVYCGEDGTALVRA